VTCAAHPDRALQGEWYGKSAGGCRNHPTCPNNQQYLLKVKQKASVTIILTQNDVEDFECIGFYILKTKGMPVIPVPTPSPPPRISRSLFTGALIIMLGADLSRKIMRVVGTDIIHKTDFSSGREGTFPSETSIRLLSLSLSLSLSPGFLSIYLSISVCIRRLTRGQRPRY
jgi:hypothetical protein